MTSIYQAVFDSLEEQIAVIDSRGRIVEVNKAWRDFGEQNGLSAEFSTIGANYLATLSGVNEGSNCKANEILIGINKVISGEQKAFNYEYPCHSPKVKRWFIMRVTPLASPENNTNYVISHQNITNRVLAEQQVELLAMQDALTGLSNRRAFNQFFEHELSVCTRKQVPVSVALIDLDYFKQLNDTYGHAAGDECLSNIGTILNNYIRRGGDFAARLGGDEFIVVFIDTDEENAKTMLDKLLSNINNIKLKTAAEQTVAASIGAVTLTPTNQDNLESIVKQADVALYKSKMLGRNQITFAD